MSDFVIKYWLQIVFGVITAGLTAAYANVRHKLKRQKNSRAGDTGTTP